MFARLKMNTLAPLAVLLALLGMVPAQAQVDVPADISIGLSADPSTGLVPGQPILFTLSATNHGPEPVDNLLLISVDFVDEIDPSYGSTDCQGLGVVVSDGQTYHYNYWWRPTFDGVLNDGATRTCHLEIALSSRAPPIWAFGFAVADFYFDINPANNSATVILQRAVDGAVPVPTLSSALLILLAALLTCIGCAMLRKSAVRTNTLRRG